MRTRPNLGAEMARTLFKIFTITPPGTLGAEMVVIEEMIGQWLDTNDVDILSHFVVFSYGCTVVSIFYRTPE
jgi:hypothetical protein